MPKVTNKVLKSSQSNRLMEAAKEAGCSEYETAFDKA